MIHFSSLMRCVCVVLTVLVVLTATGCCSRTRKKPAGGVDSTSLPVDNTRTSNEQNGVKVESVPAVFTETPAALSDSEKLTASLYLRLENAFDMYKSDNIDGAQREIERVQLEIRNDPHLEMQTWYLSAMIYHKSGKTSRRKRSMRKMLEVMEQLQKDPRFRRSFEDGMVSQDVIKLAIEKGVGRYVE